MSVDQENKILEDFGGDLTLPENFEKTVPVFDPSVKTKHCPAPVIMTNPQTTLLCTMLEVTDPNAVFLGKDSNLDFSVNQSTDAGDEDEDGDQDSDDEMNDTAIDSEPSFVSFTESDASFSLLSSSNAEDSVMEEEDEFKEIMAAQKKHNRKGSGSELECSSTNSEEEGSSELSELTDAQSKSKDNSTDSDEVDPDFQKIIEEQKRQQNVDNSSQNNKSGEDQCKNGENMLVSPNKLLPSSQSCSSQSEVEVPPDEQLPSSQSCSSQSEEEDAEFLAIMEAKKKRRIPVSQQIELSVSALHQDLTEDPGSSQPSSQPMTLINSTISEERSDTEVTLKTNELALSNKRTEESESEESPQSKKFKRRNQQIYTNNDEDMSL